MERFRIERTIIEIVKKPAETLSNNERLKLIEQAIFIARSAFKNDAITEEDIITHAIGVSTAVYIKDEEGNLLAFSTCVPEKANERTVVHLKGTAVAAELQGQGLYSLLNPLRLLFEAENHAGQKFLVGTRTQNPWVYEKISQLGLFPKVDEVTPEWLKPIAKEYAAVVRDKHSDFMSVQGLQFDIDMLIVRRAYGKVKSDSSEETFCLYGDDIPQARDKRINKFLHDNLNFSNGDAVLLIGPYSQSLCLQMLKQYRGDTTEIVHRFESP